MEALGHCRELGLAVNVLITVYRDYTKTDSFKKLIDYCIKQRIAVVINVAIPFGNWRNKTEVLISENDRETLYRLFRRYPFIKRDLFPDYNREGCPAFKRIAYLTEYGDILPCVFTHISFGDIRQITLREAQRRAFRIKYFRDYNACCLTAEDRDFINKYMKRINEFQDYPPRAEEIFESQV